MYHHWICSPERMKLFEHKKAHKHGGCIFCKIAKGDKKVSTKILHKDNKFMVIMNIYPYNTGHLLVMPVKHTTFLEDLPDQDVSALFVLVKKSVKLLKRVIKPDAFNIGLNQGIGVAGASIPHLHIHVVPRFKSDCGFIDMIGSTKILPEAVGVTYKKLRPHAKMLE